MASAAQGSKFKTEVVAPHQVNPFYREAIADKLQPVSDQIREISSTASENDRPCIKMDITLLFLNSHSILKCDMPLESRENKLSCHINKLAV